MDTEEMQAQATLFAKLARVMGKVRSLPKTGHNTHFNYKFVTDGAVSDAISAALATENVAFIPSILESHTDGKITRTRFLMTFACGDTGAIFQSYWEGEGMDNQDKGVAKSATSAVKYFLLKTFLIDTGERADDPDNDAVHDKKGKSGGDKPAKPGVFAGNKADAFMDWAQASFDISGVKVLKALENAHGAALASIDLWPYTNGEAVGALLAYAVEYDPVRLDKYIDGLKATPNALLSSSGQPFTAAQLDQFRQHAAKLAKGS